MPRGGAPLALEEAEQVGLSFAKTETYYIPIQFKASCAKNGFNQNQVSLSQGKYSWSTPINHLLKTGNKGFGRGLHS